MLYPLNQLKTVEPEIYEKHIAKYAGREHITEMRILPLDCLWNDVLHFSAVHPNIVREALIEAGTPLQWRIDYFEIDPHLLDPKHTTVYLFRDREKGAALTPENFVPYDPDNLEKYAIIPEETKAYYKETLSQGKNPLTFRGIPHILYKGTIDVRQSGIKRLKL